MPRARMLAHRSSDTNTVSKVLHRWHADWTRELQRWESGTAEARVQAVEILALDLAKAFYPKDEARRRAFVRASTTARVILAATGQVRDG